MEKHHMSVCSFCFSFSTQFYNAGDCIKPSMHAQLNGITEFQQTIKKILKINDSSDESANVCTCCKNQLKEMYSSMDQYSKNIRYFSPVVRLKKLKMVTVIIKRQIEGLNKRPEVDLDRITIKEEGTQNETKSEIMENIQTDDYRVMESSNNSKCLVQSLSFKEKQIDKRYQKATTKSSFECKQCFVAFRTKLGLDCHGRNTHDKQPNSQGDLKGDKCKKNLKNHVESPAEVLYHCDLCSLQFCSEVILQMHKHYTHIGARFKCNECEKDFSTIKILKNHKKLHSGNSFPCNQCSATFHTVPNLQAHKHKRHSDLARRFECDQCGKDFLNINSLKIHKELHTGKTLNCDECSANFQTSRNLLAHKCKWHSDLTKRYKCDRCRKHFKDSYFLKRHQKKHDGNCRHGRLKVSKKRKKLPT